MSERFMRERAPVRRYHPDVRRQRRRLVVAARIAIEQRRLVARGQRSRLLSVSWPRQSMANVRSICAVMSAKPQASGTVCKGDNDAVYTRTHAYAPSSSAIESDKPHTTK